MAWKGGADFGPVLWVLMPAEKSVPSPASAPYANVFAWPTHLESVRRHIFDKLAPRDSAVLTRALQHIAHSD